MKNEELRAKLQAVVLADSFYRRLSPPTLTRPKALLPLVNTPLIDYAMHFLHSNGVQEVFVVCRAFAAEVSAHLDTIKTPNMDVKTVVVSEHCGSIGDVFRHIDSLEIIRSDPFIVIGSDTVADLDLKKVLEAHKRRAKADALNIMTLIFKRAQQNHRCRSGGDELVVAISNDDGRLLSYENDVEREVVSTEIEVMAEQSGVCFHSDLFDTHILVCSPEVLKLFSDQFDLQNVEGDLFAQVLGNSILGHRIFTHIETSKYAARVNCWKTFDSISRDIVERWAFEFSMDHNVFDGNNYSFQRVNVFKEDGVRLAQSSKVEENSVIARGSILGDNSSVSGSIIGRGCVIGANVHIDGSHLWNNVTIEDNVIIDRALLCDNVIVKAGAVLEKGVVLSFGVVVGPDVCIPAYTKAWIPPDDDYDDDESLSLGENCEGVVFEPCDVDDDDVDDDTDVGVEDSDDEALDERSRALRDLARVSVNSIAPDVDAITWWQEYRRRMRRRSRDDDDDEDDAESVLTFASDDDVERIDALADADETEWDAEQEERFRVAKLYHEIAATIRRSVEQEIDDKDAIMLEVSSLKFSDNASISNFAASVLLALFDEIEPTPVDADQPPTRAVLSSLSRQLKEWKFLLENYNTEEHDQVLLVMGLEVACLYDGKPYRSLFPFTLQALYQLDVVGREAVLEWAERCSSLPEDSPQGRLRVAADKLIQFLLDESSEEEDDEEEESDDE